MGRVWDFLSLYPKESTKRVYRAGIFDFFDFVYGRKIRKKRKATREEMEEYERLAEEYFTKERDYFDDMLRFIAYMNGGPPIGQKAKIAGVKEFLSYYGVEFTQRQLKQLSTKMPKGKTARTAEKDIDTDMLRKILTHADLKLKALILTLASSGMRIGEALQIRLSDIDLSKDPAQIVVRGEYTKSGDTRTIFVSGEAKEVLKEWLKVRNQYLKSAVGRNRGLVEKAEAKEKPIADDRLFPFSDRNVREMWENALKKAGLWNKDTSTGRNQVRIHALRRFFRSQLALGCPVDIVEALMGHEGYLTEAYRRYTLKQMAEYYKKAEHLVTISQSQSIEKIKEEIRSEMTEVIERLVLENRELKERLNRIEKAFSAFAKIAMEDPESLPMLKEFLEKKKD
jgi:integrase